MRENEQDDFPVTKLLRLKRYEQPPPEYFEKFLCEFQQRQRSELLRRPAWKIALEQGLQSLQNLRGLLSISQLSYAGASFAVLAVAGVVTLHILQHPGGAAAIASNQPPPSQEVAAREFTLSSQVRVPDTFQPQTAQAGATNQHPRYILDARPVSYEPPSHF